MASKIEILLLGNAKQLRSELSSTGRSADSTFQKIQRGARVAGLALGGALAIGAKVGFDELSQQLKVAAQTTAVLKSTGNAANVTAGHVNSLAGEISNYSGQDDEAVQSGENMLLTFTQIQNRVGKNNDVFDQATKVTADLSQAMGMDMSKAALQVGKALNDPARGYARLQRIGVAFTAGQIKSITAMQKAGDTAGAQKVILAELSKEFGGSAKQFGQTLPGQLNIAKESFNNLAGEIVKALLPAFVMLTTNLVTGIHWLQQHEAVAKVLVGAIAALAAVLLTVSVATKIYAAGQTIASAATWLLFTSTNAETGAVTGLGLAQKVAAVFTAAWTGAQWLLNAALTANPIGLVILAVVALAAVIVIAWKRSSTFRAIVTGAFNAVKAAGSALAGALSAAFHAIASAATSVAHTVMSTWTRVVGFFRGVKGRLSGAFSGMFDGIKGAFRSAINWVINAWNGLEFSIPKIDTHIPGVGTVGGGSFGTPDIPNVAHGGIVRARPGGTILRAGEARKREAIIPLPRGFDLARMGGVEVNVELSRDAIAGIARVEVKRGNERVTRVIEAGTVWS